VTCLSSPRRCNYSVVSPKPDEVDTTYSRHSGACLVAQSNRLFFSPRSIIQTFNHTRGDLPIRQYGARSASLATEGTPQISSASSIIVPALTQRNKADKALSGASGGFSFFGGREDKFQNAADLYIQAANAFRMQKSSAS